MGGREHIHIFQQPSLTTLTLASKLAKPQSTLHHQNHPQHIKTHQAILNFAQNVTTMTFPQWKNRTHKEMKIAKVTATRSVTATTKEMKIARVTATRNSECQSDFQKHKRHNDSRHDEMERKARRVEKAHQRLSSNSNACGKNAAGKNRPYRGVRHLDGQVGTINTCNVLDGVAIGQSNHEAATIAGRKEVPSTIGSRSQVKPPVKHLSFEHATNDPNPPPQLQLENDDCDTSSFPHVTTDQRCHHTACTKCQESRGVRCNHVHDGENGARHRPLHGFSGRSFHLRPSSVAGDRVTSNILVHRRTHSAMSRHSGPTNSEHAVNPDLSQLSIRHGGCTTMGLMGVEQQSIMTFTQHRGEPMLNRYMSHGLFNLALAKRQAAITTTMEESICNTTT